MTTLTRLSEAEYNALKNEVDSENGAGFALYVKLARQSNSMGTATPLTQTFADNLTASYNNRLPFDRTLPSYITYSAVFDEYEAATPPPAPTRVPGTRRPAVSTPAPAGRTGGSDPLGVDPLDDDFDDAPIAPVAVRPTYNPAARYEPVAPAGEPTMNDLFAALSGVKPVLDDHADMLDRHSQDIDEIFEILDDQGLGRRVGTTRPWYRRSSSAHVSDGGSWAKIIGVAVVAFLGAFLVLLAIVGIIGAIVNYGPIAAIATWLWLITLLAILAAIVASLLSYRSTTASAVTREERI